MVDILLTTYNGEKFLEEQLKSIFDQTYKNFKVFICDDKSTDKTTDIIKLYKEKFFEKIEVVELDKKLGHCYNFLNLLKYSSGDYVMFCDQDDIWFFDKIEKSLDEIKEFEDEKIPLLLHTDQVIVNELGEVVNESSTNYFSKIIEFKSIEELAFRGGLHGCTMLLNRHLVNKLKEKKIWEINGFVYHDWTISIIAMIVGKILYLNLKTMNYRVHNGNASLEANKGVIENLKNIKKRILNKRKIFYQYYIVQGLFFQKNQIKNIYELNYLKRLKLNYRLGSWKYETNFIKKIIKIFEI